MAVSPYNTAPDPWHCDDGIAWASSSADDGVFSCNAFSFDNPDNTTSTPSPIATSSTNMDVFNWQGLPNELKANVIEFCISTPTTYSDIFHKQPRRKPCKKYREPCELIQKLGPWAALLFVSAQVRAITLHLCFNGSIYFPKGFCMESWSPRDLKKRFRKLDCHLITSEPDSVIPSDKKHPSTVQASQYRDHPGVYPEFARFATFKHGIRKIFLKFSFCDYLHFFKVTAHSFDAWHRRGAFTCDVFQQLPHLNELVVALPTGAQIKQHPHDRAPHLFDDNFPCPRIILRLIYEQIAVELATYDNVTVLNFLDPEDEQHFNNLRQSARLELKFAPAEFKELYADDGGGIQIQSSEDEDATTTTTETATESLECDDVIKFPDTNFWPPPCICKYSCHDKFLGIVRKEE